jgi:hypothetical protein
MMVSGRSDDSAYEFCLSNVEGKQMEKAIASQKEYLLLGGENNHNGSVIQKKTKRNGM